MGGVRQTHLKHYLENVFDALQSKNLLPPNADKEKTVNMVKDVLNELINKGLEPEKLLDKKKLGLIFQFTVSLQQTPGADKNPALANQIAQQFAELILEPKKSPEAEKQKLFLLFAMLKNDLEPNPEKKLSRDTLKNKAERFFDMMKLVMRPKETSEEKEDKKEENTLGITNNTPSAAELTNRNLYGGKDPTKEDSVTYTTLVQRPNTAGITAQAGGAGGDLSAFAIFDEMNFDTRIADPLGKEARTKQSLISLGDTLESALDGVEVPGLTSKGPTPPWIPKTK